MFRVPPEASRPWETEQSYVGKPHTKETLGKKIWLDERDRWTEGVCIASMLFHVFSIPMSST
jgi:hypothetical protein